MHHFRGTSGDDISANLEDTILQGFIKDIG